MVIEAANVLHKTARAVTTGLYIIYALVIAAIVSGIIACRYYSTWCLGYQNRVVSMKVSQKDLMKSYWTTFFTQFKDGISKVSYHWDKYVKPKGIIYSSDTKN